MMNNYLPTDYPEVNSTDTRAENETTKALKKITSVRKEALSRLKDK
jgi:hypothetical protein